MKSKIIRLVTNPFTLVIPFLAIIIIGWHQYTYAGLALNTPDFGKNVLSNGTFTEIKDNVPVGWHISSSSVDYAMSYSDGYVSGRNLDVTVSKYVKGNVDITSPRASLQPHQTYLFKGYYKSSAPVALLARYFHANGDSELVYLQTYRDSSGTWSTVSDALDSGNDISAVQYEYRLAAPGLLQINGVYIEPKPHVYVTPATGGVNRIPNALLAPAEQADMPDQWLPYKAGDNTALFADHTDTAGTYLTASLSSYRNGEAKWQYLPQPVVAHQYYRFGVTYKSDVPVHVEAEYVMADGSRTFNTTMQLMPADEWTAVAGQIEVPSHAVTMMVSVVLKSTGTLDTRQYILMADTKPGAPTWQRPLVTISFDDGWQSAYTAGVPVLDLYGYKATFYINPASIETPNFMSAKELRILSQQGQEIAAHGYAHDDFIALDNTALSYQLRQGKNYLQQAGYHVSDLATPYGDSDAEVQWYARQYFQTMRSTETGLNTRQNFDPYNLQILYVDTSVTNEEVRTALSEAEQNNGWLILVYHRIGTSSKPPASLKVENTTVTANDFKKQMELVKASGVSVLPVDAAYAEVAKQQ